MFDEALTVEIFQSVLTMRRRGKDIRLMGVLLLGLGVLLVGYLVTLAPSRGVGADRSVKSAESGFSGLRASAIDAGLSELEEKPVTEASRIDDPVYRVLSDARKELRRKEYDGALRLLNDARPLLKDNAEAYLLIGKALEGRQDFVTARDFYNAALSRDPWLSDAHWGFATASEALGDLESALGGMRSYLHTEKDPDPKRLRVSQARSAIWEWESKLGRGAWGPTKGIPPGFSAADLKRDDRGVGVKVPIPGTEQPDGSMKSEVKSAEKQKIYPRP